MKPLRLLFYYHKNKHTALGHLYRSTALAQLAHSRGHQVTVASDYPPPSPLRHFSARYLDVGDYIKAIQATLPDWVIVDLPDTLPGWMEEVTPGNVKICVLNGIGYDQRTEHVALRVIQGVADLELPKGMNLDNTLVGLDYVIIRPEIARFRDVPKHSFLFCWPGGTDVMGMFPRFNRACPDIKSALVTCDLTPNVSYLHPNHVVLKFEPESLDIFNWMGGSRKAVVAVGVICMELSYLRVPVVAFPATPLHLTFGQGLERAGLIKVWPKVGLPETDEEFRDFILQPFEPAGRPVDGLGAERILREIERR